MTEPVQGAESQGLCWVDNVTRLCTGNATKYLEAKAEVLQGLLEQDGVAPFVESLREDGKIFSLPELSWEDHPSVLRSFLEEFIRGVTRWLLNHGRPLESELAAAKNVVKQPRKRGKFFFSLELGMQCMAICLQATVQAIIGQVCYATLQAARAGTAVPYARKSNSSGMLLCVCVHE